MSILPTFIRRRIAHRPNLFKIVDNISWLFFDKILRMGVGLLVGLWVARYLGPKQFGVLNFASAFVDLFGSLAALGLHVIVVRDIVRNPSDKENILGTAAVLQFFGGLVTYSILVATIFWIRPDDIVAKAIVSILGTVMVFKFTEIAQYWFESQVQSKYTVWVQNSVFLMFSVIKVLLILQSAPLISFVYVMVAESFVVSLLMLTILNMYGPRIQKFSVTLKRAKTLLADGWPLLFSSVAVMIYMKIDQIMIGEMMGDEAVGIYSAAVRISEVWYFIPMAIAASVFPTILEAKEQSTEKYYQQLQHLYDLMVWISISVALPMTFLSAPIVNLLFGVGYEGAGPVLAVHIWASMFVFLGIASGKWFVAENRQMLSLQRTALGAIANIIFNIMLIPDYGILGAAWATVFSYAIAGMLSDIAQIETRKMFLMKLRAFNIFGAFRRSIFPRLRIFK